MTIRLDPRLTNVLIYGHGDVVFGMEGKWQNEMDPWAVTEDSDHWYGRGTALYWDIGLSGKSIPT